MRNLARILDGDQLVPSVQRLIPEVSSMKTKTFPDLMSAGLSDSVGRLVTALRVPLRTACSTTRASLELAM